MLLIDRRDTSICSYTIMVSPSLSKTSISLTMLPRILGGLIFGLMALTLLFCMATIEHSFLLSLAIVAEPPWSNVMNSWYVTLPFRSGPCFGRFAEFSPGSFVAKDKLLGFAGSRRFWSFGALPYKLSPGCSICTSFNRYGLVKSPLRCVYRRSIPE